MSATLLNRSSNSLELENNQHQLTSPAINDSFLFGDLPDDEFLKRLPLKSLLRCMCVQKSWYRLIKTPNFINLHTVYQYHHQNNNNNNDDDPPSKYLLFSSPHERKLLYLRYDDEQCAEFRRLKYPHIPPDVHGHSNGLICFSNLFSWRNFYSDIFLWNPLIKKTKTLPPLRLLKLPSHSYVDLVLWRDTAFAYLPSINDYQVVKIMFQYDPFDPYQLTYLFCVYSLSTDSWKAKFCDPCDTNVVRMNDEKESVFVDGIACWMIACDDTNLNKVLCFHTINFTLHFVDLPQVGEYHRLHQFGQSVALFTEDKLNNFHMSILKQDSITNDFFWENKVTVELQQPIFSRVIGLRNNGELVLVKKSQKVYGLVSYDPESKNLKDFVQSWKGWSTRGYDDLFDEHPPFLVHPFVGSLVLMNTDSNNQPVCRLPKLQRNKHCENRRFTTTAVCRSRMVS
ncbi:hypothetical protein POM88_033962 [Heracleum sosnowskyi]|uniref:F-box domain-containing protein n=1 Tax=Heracleum sosnowskyi TaxID=360622 RepID=A0AAD8HKT4_9APIA|nr:hypothetical protein POM88_033962 [Heracleum sosnowskyi]